MAYATPVGALVGVCGGIAYILRARARQMQNNLADSQHFGGVSVAVAKASPPIAVSGLTLSGVQLQDWLIMTTLLYTVIQIIIALPKLKSLFKEWRNK